MGAIDFRFRPVGTQSITRELTWEYLRKMRLQPAPSFERQDMDLMFREMDEAGIEMGVIGVPAPSDKPGFESTGNKVIAALVKRHPKLLEEVEKLVVARETANRAVFQDASDLIV